MAGISKKEFWEVRALNRRKDVEDYIILNPDCVGAATPFWDGDKTYTMLHLIVPVLDQTVLLIDYEFDKFRDFMNSR